jgi:hypothetical protein
MADLRISSFCSISSNSKAHAKILKVVKDDIIGASGDFICTVERDAELIFVVCFPGRENTENAKDCTGGVGISREEDANEDNNVFFNFPCVSLSSKNCLQNSNTVT